MSSESDQENLVENVRMYLRNIRYGLTRVMGEVRDINSEDLTEQGFNENKG